MTDGVTIKNTASFLGLMFFLKSLHGYITVAQNLMYTDDGTVLAELDMRLTHDQFYNLYEQPTADA